MDFAHSERAQDYLKRVGAFLETEIRPVEEPYLRELHAREDRWVVLPIVEELKARARERGLWNLFLPDERYGPGLSNSEYAPLAELMGAGRSWRPRSSTATRLTPATWRSSRRTAARSRSSSG